MQNFNIWPDWTMPYPFSLIQEGLYSLAYSLVHFLFPNPAVRHGVETVCALAGIFLLIRCWVACGRRYGREKSKGVTL